MPSYNIILPSKPKVVSETDTVGVYEIEGFYPGYGHTIGNSLRRIILSSLSGSAVTSIKIDGVSHEFSTIDGVKEDVVAIILNVKRLRFRMEGDEPQTVKVSFKGPGVVTAKDLILPSQVQIFDKDAPIAEVTGKGEFNAEMIVENGLGYVSKEDQHKEKVAIGQIALDTAFTPIRRVNYEVDNMRVGDRTDFNKLTIHIETDGLMTPREALEKAVEIMITQLKAIIGFKEEESLAEMKRSIEERKDSEAEAESDDSDDITKTKIEDLDGLSTRTISGLTGASIKTVSGLLRKTEDDILELDGLGKKAVEEIKEALAKHNLALKE